MLIDFPSIPVTTIPNMRGGEKEFRVHTYTDDMCRIMRGTLIPGASIGLHTHDTNSEIIYILRGAGTLSCDGVREPGAGGSCHYCPKRHAHTFINDGDEDLEFFAVVPEQ